jgi:branched-chain amino acid transport system ATP-binding protein
MNAPLLSLTNVSAAYGQVVALEGISLSMAENEIVALIGANGAGKTTLLKLIAGLLRPRAGTLAFNGQPLAGVAVHRRARLGIGYSPEGRRVFPGLTVRENLEVASHTDLRGTAESIDGVYAMFPALAQKDRALAWTLSGGQQQMLAIGRALMVRPKLLLLDEPSLGLSPKLADEVLHRLPAIAASGTTALLAEQNAFKALDIAHRAYVLRNGRIVHQGQAAALKQDPGIGAAMLGGQ